MNHECLNHASWLNLEFAASFAMKFKLWSYTQYYRSSMVSSWYIFCYIFPSSSHVLLIFEGEAGRRPWIDPDDILDYYFARWNLPVAIPAQQWKGTSKRRAVAVTSRFRLQKMNDQQELPNERCEFYHKVVFLAKPGSGKTSLPNGMLGHKLLRRCSRAGCIFVIGQEDPTKKAWKKPDEFMCLVLPFVCPPLAKGTWGSLQSRFFQSGKVLFWFKSRSTWLERLQKITEKLSPWNQSLLWTTGLMPFLSKQKMQANVEEALLSALVKRSLSLFENKDVPAINKWFLVVLWPSS